MENFEHRLNNTDAPHTRIDSHRDALRGKLRNVKPRTHAARNSMITMVLMLILGMTGLTIANPDWPGELYRTIIVREINLTTDDGEHIKIRCVQAECDSAATCCDWVTNQTKADIVKNLKSGDPMYDEVLKSHAGFTNVIKLDAEISNIQLDENGEGERKMMIMCTDDGNTFVINGDTVESVETITALKDQCETTMKVFEDESATEAWVTSAEETATEAIAGNFELHQNYPNPFNPSTTIAFDLQQAGEVQLRVFDITGREVAELVNGPLASGSHNFKFDGAGLASGTYFYTLTAGNYSETKNMVLMK